MKKKVLKAKNKYTRYICGSCYQGFLLTENQQKRKNYDINCQRCGSDNVAPDFNYVEK